MLRFFLLSFFVLASAGLVYAQIATDSGNIVAKDTLPVIDSPMAVRDSLPILPVNDSVSKKPWQYFSMELNPALPLSSQLLRNHPYFNFSSKPIVVHPELKEFKGKEILFYVLIAYLLAFAFLKQAFPKYFNDLFTLLFRTTLKQKQLREQLMQTPLPSFLLNIFFAFSGGFYINLLLHHFGQTPVNNFWLLLLYCSLGLAVIYAVKFVGLNISGWLFNMKTAAKTYAFIVFMINKVIGIFLLPFLILLSFLEGDAYTTVMVLSWFGIALMFIYRYFLTYTSVRNQVRFNPFHFFLYLCAFEIAPLLLIYKALLFFFQ